MSEAGPAPEAAEQTKTKEHSRRDSYLFGSSLCPFRAREVCLTLRMPLGTSSRGRDRPCSPSMLRPTYLSLLLQLCPSLPLFAVGFTMDEMGLAVKFACEKRYTHTYSFSLQTEPWEQMLIPVQAEHSNHGNKPSSDMSRGLYTCPNVAPRKGSYTLLPASEKVLVMGDSLSGAKNPQVTPNPNRS